MLFLNHELATLIEGDLCKGNQRLGESWAESDSTDRAVALELDGGLAVYGGADCPINEAVGLGMSSPVDAGTLSKIEAFYESHDHPSVIRVCPLAHPSLVDVLRKRGYGLTSFAYRWVLDLQSWESPFDQADFRVREAASEEELTWARTVAAGFGDVDNVPENHDLSLDRAFFRMPSTIPIIAIEDGQHVAGGVLALNDNIASLFATSVQPAYRKRGLQTAMLDWRLRFAKTYGARIATIETDPDSDSQRNVERMGFRLAYVAVQMVKPLKNSEG